MQNRFITLFLQDLKGDKLCTLSFSEITYYHTVSLPAAPAAPFCSFSVEFSTFSCCFQNVFHFPAANFPLAAEFFLFLQLPAKWELHALSFLSPLCECVAGSQIGHLLCEDCKFLIRVRRCHTIRITRKASPPCVPAGKNGAVDHFCERHIPRCNKM